MRVSFADNTYGPEEEQAVLDVMRSGFLTMGKRVAEFEEAWADYIGVKHAIMVNSGSSANLIALASLIETKRLLPGDEVVTPAVTWATTVFPIAQLGLVPVLVDVNRYTFTMDLYDAVSRSSSDTVKAIMPVHLLGYPAHIPLAGTYPRVNGVSLIEDACEAHGATYPSGQKVGSLGDVGTFSFFFSHHITTIEGGMLTTNNDDIDMMARRLRAFGWAREEGGAKFEFHNAGYNVRPTEINAALGLVQLPKLDRILAQRHINVERLNLIEGGANIQDEGHACFAYAVSVPGGCGPMVDHLTEMGIETRPVMAANIAEQPVMKSIKHRIIGDLVNSKRITKESFLIPCHESLTNDQLDFMVETINEFTRKAVSA